MFDSEPTNSLGQLPGFARYTIDGLLAPEPKVPAGLRPMLAKLSGIPIGDGASAPHPQTLIDLRKLADEIFEDPQATDIVLEVFRTKAPKLQSESFDPYDNSFGRSI